MPVHIHVSDETIIGFTEPAQRRLQEAGDAYVSSVIEEAYRIEAGQNTSGGQAEITQSMVDDAVVVRRHRVPNRQGERTSKLLKIGSSVLSLLSGWMFSLDTFSTPWLAILFSFVAALAFLTLSLSILRE
jgi:hypothetical protein